MTGNPRRQAKRRPPPPSGGLPQPSSGGDQLCPVTVPRPLPSSCGVHHPGPPSSSPPGHGGRALPPPSDATPCRGYCMAPSWCAAATTDGQVRIYAWGALLFIVIRTECNGKPGKKYGGRHRHIRRDAIGPAGGPGQPFITTSVRARHARVNLTAGAVQREGLARDLRPLSGAAAALVAPPTHRAPRSRNKDASNCHGDEAVAHQVGRSPSETIMTLRAPTCRHPSGETGHTPTPVRLTGGQARPGRLAPGR